MALIKCPDCGKEISDLAEACIHCGRPIQPRNKKKYKQEIYISNYKKGKPTILMGWILMFLTFFPILGFVVSGNGDLEMVGICGVGFLIGIMFVIVGTFIKWWHN